MGLFLYSSEAFKLHSGLRSKYLIDCDMLSDEDLTTIAFRLVERLPPFSSVEGIPRGGLRLAEVMRGFQAAGPGKHLIVDDVWTTGQSMQKAWDDWHGPEAVIGAVIFRRGLMVLPSWVVSFGTIDIY